MTKFVFHGGFSPQHTMDNRDFFRECLTGLTGPVNVALLYLAREPESWDESFRNDETTLRDVATAEITCVCGSIDQQELQHQMDAADVIIVPGGNLLRLDEMFAAVPNMHSLVDRKVYGGSSAGVNVLARYYYSNSFGKIMNGIGFLPIKTFVHWDPSKQKQYEELKTYGEDLEILSIPEMEYIIREES